MSKVNNETKLVLELAVARAAARKEEAVNNLVKFYVGRATPQAPLADMQPLIRRCVCSGIALYQQTLNDIILELEGR